MAQNYFVMSYFKTRYFMADFTDTNTVPGTGSADNELDNILTCNLGAISKENTKYRTLNSNGWESIAVLGNTQDDAEFSALIDGTEAYAGVPGTATYTRVRDWFMKATASGGLKAPKAIVEVVPRGTGYEGTCYYVVPSNWNPGERNTDSGQEYSFTVTPFGPPVPVTVTYQQDSDSFTFAKISG